MDQFISGYADDEVNYCPYCGEEVYDSNCENEFECNSCFRSFYVIEGE